MTQTVSMPLWVFVLVVLFAAVTFASHFLFPSVRWFFRKRAERVIARVNQRLQRPIEPFKLARRYDMIQRLIYDPEVTQAIFDHAKSNNIPENVAFEKAKRYAREIVPSFSATAYFGIGIRLARWLSTSLYEVKLEELDRETLAHLDADATVIFVINHRSNMDYILVTYLAANSGALSYAVGEWARVWPLSFLIRAMGAYFIRRKSRGALYRKVLARYVQMATRGGVTQAVFPEGGLSLDGKLAEPKLGLLSYILEDFDPERRDVIFVPVALNYDRVLEDTFLIAAGKSGRRRFRPPLLNIVKRLGRHAWLRLTRRLKKFGVASVSFGRPMALSDLQRTDVGDLPAAVANEMMRRIAEVVPLAQVPLIARHLLTDVAHTKDTLTAAIHMDLQKLPDVSAPEPGDDLGPILEQLESRNLVSVDSGSIKVTATGQDILTYYASSIAHHFKPSKAPEDQDAALAK